MEVDRIIKKLEEIENRLISVENGNIITNSNLPTEPGIINNFVYDAYLADYLNEETASTFAYKETKACYDEYAAYRKTMCTDDTLIASMRLFNKMVRNRFPMLTINHVNRKGKNIYIWDVKGDM